MQTRFFELEPNLAKTLSIADFVIFRFHLEIWITDRNLGAQRLQVYITIHIYITIITHIFLSISYIIYIYIIRLCRHAAGLHRLQAFDIGRVSAVRSQAGMKLPQRQLIRVRKNRRRARLRRSLQIRLRLSRKGIPRKDPGRRRRPCLRTRSCRHRQRRHRRQGRRSQEAGIALTLSTRIV